MNEGGRRTDRSQRTEANTENANGTEISRSSRSKAERRFLVPSLNKVTPTKVDEVGALRPMYHHQHLHDRPPPLGGMLAGAMLASAFSDRQQQQRPLAGPTMYGPPPMYAPQPMPYYQPAVAVQPPWIGQQQLQQQQQQQWYPQPDAAPLPQPAPVQPKIQFMAAPPLIPDVPPGLEYLAMIDQLIVQEQVQLIEVFTNFEPANRFHILNSMGQQVYYAGEESDVCLRQCCAAGRAFTMHITDNFGREVIRAQRPFSGCAGVNCCAGYDCCAMELTVEAPPGFLVGRVKQQQSCLAPVYHIQDGKDNTIFIIEGPTVICHGCYTLDQDFMVLAADGRQDVGKISKQWSGFVQEIFTDATNFGISFPIDLDARMKATMIGAVFLIDFMFFEDNRRDRFDQTGYGGYGGGLLGGGFGGGFTPGYGGGLGGGFVGDYADF